MHAAPPVCLACNRGALWPLLQRAAFAVAAAVFVAWSALHLGASGWFAALVAAAAAGRGARRGVDAPAELVWDGQSWLLRQQPGRVDVAADLGAWLLLCFTPEPPLRGRHWLEVRSADGGASFHRWRAALYARPVAVPGAAADGGLR